MKTLGTVIGVFLLCWVFFFIRYTFCGVGNSICPDFITNSVLLEDILFWIGYFNSMINPFLYNFTNQDFRKAFKDLLRLNRNKNNYLKSMPKIQHSTRNPSMVSSHLVKINLNVQQETPFS